MDVLITWFQAGCLVVAFYSLVVFFQVVQRNALEEICVCMLRFQAGCLVVAFYSLVILFYFMQYSALDAMVQQIVWINGYRDVAQSQSHIVPAQAGQRLGLAAVSRSIVVRINPYCGVIAQYCLIVSFQFMQYIAFSSMYARGARGIVNHILSKQSIIALQGGIILLQCKQCFGLPHAQGAHGDIRLAF